MITEEEIERAVDYLRDSAMEIGDARYRMVRAEHMRRHVRAVLMTGIDGSMALREAEAMADKRYLEAIEEEASASRAFEILKAMREAASAKIGAWQSMSANQRGRL